MLKYWHEMAPQDLKDHYRLPEVGEELEGLTRRNLDSRELKWIEECYQELRSLIKTQTGEKIKELVCDSPKSTSLRVGKAP